MLLPFGTTCTEVCLESWVLMVQELRLVQKQDKQGKDVMWCFVEFEEIVQAARCMKVLQVRAKPQDSRNVMPRLCLQQVRLLCKLEQRFSHYHIAHSAP